MDINGVNEPINAEIKIKKSADQKNLQQSTPKIENKTFEAEPVKIDVDTSNSRIRAMMKEMKSYQERVSQDQSYLDNLMKVKNAITGNKNVEQLYIEMVEIAQKARFNQKPLMDAVLPANIDFYKKYDNIKNLTQNVENEIEKTRRNITQQQQQINRYSITIENIKASLSKQELNQMQKLFADKELYKNFNQDMVASLIANK